MRILLLWGGKYMILSNRLMEISKFISVNSIVGDIGTDHGYLPIYLMENKISKMVIASDISEKSLDKIVSYVEEKGLEKDIITRLGDGLDVIKAFEVDTLVIAGMGGLLIRDILEKHKEITNSITNFILQPMVASRELRDYLVHNKFKIVDESLAREGDKFYEIIHAKSGLDYIEDEVYLDISKKLIEKNHPLLREFLNFKIYKEDEILNKLEGEASEKSRERYEEVKREKEKYMEILNSL